MNMTGIIKNCKSANIGGVTVFTYEGAEAAYRALSARVYSDLTMEASVALGDVADVMHGLGYTLEEIKAMENEAAGG